MSKKMHVVRVEEDDFYIVQEALLDSAHCMEADAREAEFTNCGWAKTDGSVASKTTKGILESTIQWAEDGTYAVSHTWQGD